MITILFQMTVKAGREDDCARVVKEVTASTRAEDEGCITYAFYRRSDSPRELILFEQWRDPASITAHMARLQRVYGPPDDNEPYPPTHHRRRISKSFLGISSRGPTPSATTRSREDAVAMPLAPGPRGSFPWLRLHLFVRDIIATPRGGSARGKDWPMAKEELARCVELRREMIEAGWFN